MTQPCEICSRPMGEQATFCAGCAYKLDAALADVCTYHGLAYDLDLAITRQARIGSRDGSRPTEAAVPVNLKASEVAGNLKGILSSWARVVHEETDAPLLGPTCRRCQHGSCAAIRHRELPPDTLTGIAAWLRPRVGWLRHHEAGAEAYDEITEAVRDARRIVDRPADKLYAGPCDECGEDLYARLEAVYVTCTSDAHEEGEEPTWSVEERRRWLLDSARDVLASGTEISRALTRYAQPVTPSALRGYVHRGQLVARGERQEGGRMVMLYRLGDVLDILQRQAERVSA